MKILSKSLTLPILFISSATVFIGALLLTHKSNMPINYPSIKESIKKETQKSWGVNFQMEDGIVTIKNMQQNSFAKEIGLKEGDKIVKLNEIYNPSIESIQNFLKNNKNKIVKLVIKRKGNLYNIKALPF